MRLGFAGLVAGLVLLVLLIAWFGARDIGWEVLAAAWSIPGAVFVHAVQLFLSALAWQQPLGRVPIGVVYRIRWIRESINSLLPVAQIGGPVTAVGLLGRAGIPLARAGAATTLDLLIEAAAQLVFVLAAVAIVLALGAGHAWIGWIVGGVIGGAVAVAAFLAVQRAGGLRLVEALAVRLQLRFPALRLDGLRGLHAELMDLHARPIVMVRALGWHTLSWSLGAFEVLIVLSVMGRPVSLPDAFVIEAFGAMARSAAFAVPGGVGVQEGGYVLAAACSASRPTRPWRCRWSSGCASWPWACRA